MDKISDNFNKYLPNKSQSTAQSANASSTLSFGSSKGDAFHASPNTPPNKPPNKKWGWVLNGLGTLALFYGSAICALVIRNKIDNIEDQNPTCDLSKVVRETFEESFNEYSKSLQNSGIKDVRKPKLRFNDTVKDYTALYAGHRNEIVVNLDNIRKIENQYFLTENNKIIPHTIIFEDGTETARVLFTEEQALKLLEANPKLKMHALGKDGVQIFTRGLIRHEMKHWQQNMGMINDPKTSEKHLNNPFGSQFELARILLHPLAMIIKSDLLAPKFKETYPFLDYKPSGVSFNFSHKIGKEEVAFTAEDMLNGLKNYVYINKSPRKYYSNPLEISAYAEATEYLKGKKDKGYDKARLNAVILELDLQAKAGLNFLNEAKKTAV